jgi:hypothetical protein
MAPIDTPEHVETLAPRQRLALYLAAGYLYHVRDESLISDATWDALCWRLLMDHADGSLAGHPHAHLIDGDALAAGTAHHLRPEQFPPRARGAAEYLLREWRDRDAPYRQYAA